MKTVSLHLDGHIASPLCWEEAFCRAVEAAMHGARLAWHLDLGLFEALPLPLGDMGQQAALALACDHFAEKIAASGLEGLSTVLLYRGSADISQALHHDARELLVWRSWLEEAQYGDGLLQEEMRGGFLPREEGRLWRLFCRDRAAAFLGDLVAHLPDAIPIKVELRWPKDLGYHEALALATQEPFCHIDVTMEGGPCGMETLQTPAEVGLVWPRRTFFSLQHYRKTLSQAFALAKGGRPWRLLPEPCITTFWEGLDTIFVDASILSPEGRRMLEGFVAAGGKICYC